MEDDFALLCVLDGHGPNGHHVSDYARKFFTQAPCFCQPLELDICSWSRAARSSTRRDCVHWFHHLSFCGPVGELMGSCHQVLVSSWSWTSVHGHLLIASRAPMCRFATLLSTETSAKDALLLTSAKQHPTQFCFSSRLQCTSRFHVEAQLEFRTLRIVRVELPLFCLSRIKQPKSDFHQTTYLRLLLATMDSPEGDPHGASFFSVSGGSDGNLSYNSVSCAQTSSEVRLHCVFDETHSSADVCCGGFLAVKATLLQPAALGQKQTVRC